MWREREGGSREVREKEEERDRGWRAAPRGEEDRKQLKTEEMGVRNRAVTGTGGVQRETERSWEEIGGICEPGELEGRNIPL